MKKLKILLLTIFLSGAIGVRGQAEKALGTEDQFVSYAGGSNVQN